MRQKIHHFLGTFLVLTLLSSTGCNGPVYTAYDPNFTGGLFPGTTIEITGFPIDRIGVCGPMSNDVTDLFVYAGYVAADLGFDSSVALDKADANKIKFVAVVERAPDGEKTPGLADDYNVIVLDLHTGAQIWRVDGEEGPGGARIRRNLTLELAFRDMVNAFAKLYPPMKRGA